LALSGTSATSPEPYDLTVDDTYVGEDGELYVGDIIILDARRNARETAAGCH
jgi:hypothetical protein